MKVLCEIYDKDRVFKLADRLFTVRHTLDYEVICIILVSVENIYDEIPLSGDINLKFYDTYDNIYSIVSFKDFWNNNEFFDKDIVGLSYLPHRMIIPVYGEFFERLAKHLDMATLKFRYPHADNVWNALKTVCMTYKNVSVVCEDNIVVIHHPNIDLLSAVCKTDIRMLFGDIAKYKMLGSF